jgi:SpoVK/Ycf46/Vps4 family AAA+-type ATPase/intein/homing endonuclease
MAETGLKLKVAEAVQDDVNKGIVRIDTSLMHDIGVRPGDIVEIEGGRTTVGIADRAYPGDIGLSIIRMDGIIRRNAKTGIGELIKTRKADVKGAKKVIIAPARKGVMIRASSDIFKQGLLGRAIVKGDIVALGGTTRRRTTFVHSPFEEIFKMLDEVDEDVLGLGFSDIKFIVVDTVPKGAVIITDLTEVVFNPEASEMAEEPRLEVTYEDIGGLSEEIKKVREMVELPLKHPEIFERLGIDAPKGVLLHGPPGTGKTLVAKAVANETNAYFTHINGPEIMSKFYGQSLPPDEKIAVVEKGEIKRLPIGEVVDSNKKGLEVLCFDEKGKVVINKVSDLIKHPLRSKILKIKTRSGREIRVTDYHSLFTLTKKGIESVKTSELKAGKSFVAVPKKLPFSPSPFNKLNLLERMREADHGLRVRNVQEYVRKAIDALGMEKTAGTLGIRTKYLYDVISKNVGIRAKMFMKLMDTVKISVAPEFIQLYTKGKSIPSELIISEDLCTFLGLWIAEGSYLRNGVRLSLHRKEEKVMADLCTKLFGNVTIYRKPNFQASDVIICSTALKILMKDILGFVSGSRNKKIPDLVYNLPKDKLAAFLRGYVTGDGSLNTKTPAPMVEMATESRSLADDLAYLFLMFGIVVKIYGRKHRPQKRLCFADTKNLDLFREIGFLDAERNSKIFSYLCSRQISRRDKIPMNALSEETLSNSYLSSWKGLKSIGAEAVQKVADQRLQTILENDIYWDKVIDVTEVDEKPEYVYDISVEPSQNFVSGFGGIFAHNSESNLRKKFEEAEKNAPAIVFIDEIDAIASKREELHGEVEKRVVAQLLALMDGLKDRGRVVVIAATNVPNLLDPALRRPGRFDREIEIGVPGKEGRLDILKIHTRNMPLAKNVSLKEIAAITHGFVGADLSMLAKEAAMVVLRRILPDLKLDEEHPIPKEVLEQMLVSKKDFREALKVVRPSAMREVLVEIPNIKWGDIGGLEEVKQQLIEAVEWPIKNPEAFKRLGVKPPKGILLYGAPGAGKTLLAKAVATESEANFILVKGPELLSKWVGESEKAVREIFKKARQASPAVIFFDEIDSLAPKRGANQDSHVTERVVNQLLTEIDGLEQLYDTVIIAATNRPDMVDPALLRPGRFDRLILTNIPDVKSRLEIFKVHSKEMPLKNVNLEKFAQITEGYVGADIEAVCREAAILALRENMSAKVVEERHFMEALKTVSASVTKEIEKAYAEIKESLLTARAKEIKEEKPVYMG